MPSSSDAPPSAPTLPAGELAPDPRAAPRSRARGRPRARVVARPPRSSARRRPPPRAARPRRRAAGRSGSRSSGTARRRRRRAPARSRPARRTGSGRDAPECARRAAELALDERAVIHAADRSLGRRPRLRAAPLRDALDDEEPLAGPDEPIRRASRASASTLAERASRAWSRARSARSRAHLGGALVQRPPASRRSSRAAGSRGTPTKSATPTSTSAAPRSSAAGRALAFAAGEAWRGLSCVWPRRPDSAAARRFLGPPRRCRP